LVFKNHKCNILPKIELLGTKKGVSWHSPKHQMVLVSVIIQFQVKKILSLFTFTFKMTSRFLLFPTLFLQLPIDSSQNAKKGYKSSEFLIDASLKWLLS